MADDTQTPLVLVIDTDTGSGLDRRHLQLLLAALSHAGGSHQHRDIDAAGLASEHLSPLVRWLARD